MKLDALKAQTTPILTAKVVLRELVKAGEQLADSATPGDPWHAMVTLWRQQIVAIDQMLVNHIEAMSLANANQEHAGNN